MKHWIFFLLCISLYVTAFAQGTETRPTLQQSVAKWVSGEQPDGSDFGRVRRAGDSAALALTEALSGREPSDDEIRRSFYVQALAFSDPAFIINPQDREPKEAMVVLRYLGLHTADPVLKREIAEETTRLAAAAKVTLVQNKFLRSEMR